MMNQSMVSNNNKIGQYEEETITWSTGCSSDQTFIGKGQSLLIDNYVVNALWTTIKLIINFK